MDFPYLSNDRSLSSYPVLFGINSILLVQHFKALHRALLSHCLLFIPSGRILNPRGFMLIPVLCYCPWCYMIPSLLFYLKFCIPLKFNSRSTSSVRPPCIYIYMFVGSICRYIVFMCLIEALYVIDYYI